MKLSRIIFWLALVGVCLSVSVRAQKGLPAANEVLTNASVVKLARAGFSEKTIIAVIRTRPSRFDLATDRLIELKRSNVSEKVILAMLAVANPNAALDDWDDLDDDSAGLQLPNGKDSGNSNETGVFGSSGSAQGRSRSRGGSNGSQDNDTQLLGSASVRIVRPSGEGRVPPKLERTPALNNDAVIKLVEAGFTDGTIINRINQSPVDFDLSATSLEQLRRHRVTEIVIAAMRTAMQGEAPPKK
jgi:hypothetical protein